MYIHRSMSFPYSLFLLTYKVLQVLKVTRYRHRSSCNPFFFSSLTRTWNGLQVKSGVEKSISKIGIGLQMLRECHLYAFSCQLSCQLIKIEKGHGSFYPLTIQQHLFLRGWIFVTEIVGLQAWIIFYKHHKWHQGMLRMCSTDRGRFDPISTVDN